MHANRMAVVGIGATGTVLAAALLSKYPDTFLIGRTPNLGKTLGLRGIDVSGQITYKVAVKNYSYQIRDLKDFSPSAIFLATKTFHLEQVLGNLRKVFEPGIKIIATQNGIAAGSDSARIIPVTTALKSPSEFGFLRITLHSHSVITQLITQVLTIITA